jgi:hypothetical protein
MERKYKSHGVDVAVTEKGDEVTLELNGSPIEVAKIDGRYHSQTVHQFRWFDSLEDLVETALKNEGRFWQLESEPGRPHDHGGPGGTPDH